MTAELKIPGAAIPRRVFTHCDNSGPSHTQALGIGSPRIDETLPRNHGGIAMEQFVGLDVSLRTTAICIVDRAGKIEREGMVASDPAAIAAFVTQHAHMSPGSGSKRERHQRGCGLSSGNSGFQSSVSMLDMRKQR
jgi:hypothetical protein